MKINRMTVLMAEKIKPLSFFVLICLFLGSCTQTPTYPDRWWEVVRDPMKPRWEIFPNQVRPPQVILSKRNELGILSNFASTPFQYRGKTYASLEGFWQATKYPENKEDPRWKLASWPHTRAEVAAMVGFAAKRAGDFASRVMKKNKVDWVSFEGRQMVYREMKKGSFYHLIREAMVAKISQNQKVKKTLVSTGDLELLPDHFQGPKVPPAWRYHKIYMEFRESIKKGESLELPPFVR